jgi:hypothetical protein
MSSKNNQAPSTQQSSVPDKSDRGGHDDVDETKLMDSPRLDLFMEGPAGGHENRGVDLHGLPPLVESPDPEYNLEDDFVEERVEM